MPNATRRAGTLLLGPFLLVVLCGMLTSAPVPVPRGKERWRGAVRVVGKSDRYHRLRAISPDGKQLVISGSCGFYVYDLTKGRVVHEVLTSESTQDAAVSPDGRLLATAEWRHGVKIRDFRTMKVVDNVKGSGNLGAWQVRFTPDSKRLAVYSWWGSTVQLWFYDLGTRKELGWPAAARPDTARVMVREFLMGTHRPFLYSVERHHDNGRYTRHRVWITDPETGKRGPVVELGKHDYFQFGVRADAARGIVMQPGEAPRIIDLKAGNTVLTLAGHGRWVTAAAFSPNGRYVAAASGMTEDGHARIYTTKYSKANAPPEVIVWDAASGKELGRVREGKKQPDWAFVGFSPNGRYLYAITKENEIWLWGDLPVMPDRLEPFPKSFGYQEKRK